MLGKRLGGRAGGGLGRHTSRVDRAGRGKVV